MAITLDSVMSALRSVKDPVTQRDVMSAGLIHDLKIEGDAVSLRVTVRSPAQSLKDQLQTQVKEALVRMAGATKVNVVMEMEVKKGQVKADKFGIPGVKHIIAVSSGKGGVGKSTVSANLATALAKQGFAVGLLDSDVYGPNIPLMMGVTEAMPSARMDDERGELIIPMEAHGVKVMSMGLLTKGDQPLVWRGPMLHGVVQQFLMKVDWGKLDYLVVDMPPGTGDVQLSLTQLVPVSGAVVVTTPQEVALQDVRKAILMFEKVAVPILGIVENMSYFVCDSCDKKHEIFGSGGGQSLADKFRTKLLIQIPMGSSVRIGGDTGSPIVVRDPQSIQAKALMELAKTVSQEIELRARRTATDSGSPEISIGQF